MKTKRFSLIFVLLAASLLLSACGGSITASSWPGISTDQSIVFVANGGQLFGLNSGDGSVLWKYPEKADIRKPFYASPTLSADGQLLVGDYDHTLYSLDPKTGSVKWTFGDAKGRYIASPLATETSIYAPCADDHLYALDLSGKLQWKFEAKSALWAKPVMAGSVLYVPSMDHFLYALDSTSGKQLWSVDLGGAALGSPALSADGKSVMIGTIAKEMLSVATDTGKILWRFTTTGSIWAQPVVVDQNAYFGDLSGEFFAVDTTTGKQTWKIQPGGSIIGSALIDGDALVFSTETGSLVSVGTDGKIQWNRTVSGKLYTTPLKIGDRYLVGLVKADQILIALDASGNQAWAFTPSK